MTIKNQHSIMEIDPATRAQSQCRGLPDHATRGFSRAEWHDQAWALYQAKTFNDTMLAKQSIHTLRAVFNATYDALSEMPDNPEIGRLQTRANKLRGHLEYIDSYLESSTEDSISRLHLEGLRGLILDVRGFLSSDDK